MGKIIKTNNSFARPKLLIVGSGFHRHVLEGCKSPLACWDMLLRKVAVKQGLNSMACKTSEPTLQWEALVTDSVQKDKNQQLKASDTEKRLRKCAVEILEHEVNKHDEKYRKHKIGDMLKDFKGHIVNLNFDHMLDSLLGIASTRNAYPEIKKLPFMEFCHEKNLPGLFRRHRSLANSVTIWHPHGTIRNTETLRLGFRDYGLQPAIFSSAFDSFRNWQRKFLAKHAIDNPPNPSDYRKLIDHVEELDARQISSRTKKHDHWITRFMLYDVMIIGAGISPSEIGLRWLLVQRKRNCARIPKAQLPRTIFFNVEKNDLENFIDFDLSSDWYKCWEKALSAI